MVSDSCDCDPGDDECLAACQESEKGDMDTNGNNGGKKMSIRDITEEIGRVYEMMKGLVDASSDEGKPMDGEKESKYSALNGRLTTLIRMRDQHYRLLDAKAQAEASMDRIVERSSRERAEKPNRSGAMLMGEQLRKHLGSEQYRNAFFKYLVGAEIRPEELRVMTEGTDSAGGYLPSQDFYSVLVQKRFENCVYRQIANVIPLGTFKTQVTIESSFPTATYEAESATKSPSDAAFGNFTLQPYTMRCFTKVTNELLADAVGSGRGPDFNVESILARQFGQVMGQLEEQKFGTGSGSGEPKGIFTYTSASQIADGVTATSKTTIVASEVLNLVGSLGRAYRDGACFVMSDTLFFQLRAMLQIAPAGGTAYGGNYAPYAWSLGDGRMQDGEPDRLFGYPVYCVQSGASPSIATGARVITFGNFKNYFHIGEREGISIKVAREAYLADNQTGYFAFARNTSAASQYDAFKYLRMG